MIVRPRPHWFKMLFIWRGSVLRKLLPRLAIVGGLGVFAQLLHVGVDTVWRDRLELNLQPFTLLGLALAIFLGFRINVSHERYWDARKLWGTIMNASRALARQALTLTEWAPKSPDAQRFVRALIAHAHAFRHQLRQTDASEDLHRLLVAEDLPRVLAARWKPVVIQQLLGDQLHAARREGNLSDILSASMEQSFNTLGDAIGGCERIASTPIPLTFSVMVHRTIYFYCTLRPFALVGTIGWYARCSPCLSPTPSWRSKRLPKSLKRRSASTTTTSPSARSATTSRLRCSKCSASPCRRRSRFRRISCCAEVSAGRDASVIRVTTVVACASTTRARECDLPAAKSWWLDRPAFCRQLTCHN